jgi:hypothetical protein
VDKYKYVLICIYVYMMYFYIFILLYICILYVHICTYLYTCINRFYFSSLYDPCKLDILLVVKFCSTLIFCINCNYISSCWAIDTFLDYSFLSVVRWKPFLIYLPYVKYGPARKKSVYERNKTMRRMEHKQKKRKMK